MNLRKIINFSIGPIGSAVVGLITLPAITWFFSAEDIGRIAMLQVASSFCVLLFSLGLDQAYVREYHETTEKTTLLKTCLTPGLLLLSFIIIIALFFPGFISKLLFSIDSIEISWLVAACLISGFISRYLSLILRMQERGLAYSMSQLIPKLIFLLIIALYVWLSVEFDLSYLILAHTLSIVTVTLVYGWNTREEWVAACHKRINKSQLHSMLKFGLPLIIGGVALWGMTAIDRLLLRSFSTFDELGIYSVASNFAGVAIILQSIFSTVWAPTVYKWASEGKNIEKIDQVTEYTLIATVYLFVLTGLFSWIVTLFLPEKYHSIQYILTSCMAYPLFYTLSETTAVGLGITRKSSYSMLSAAISVSVSLISNYFLIPIYGAAGAAASTALAFWVFLVCRTEFSSIAWRNIPRKNLYFFSLICFFASTVSALLGSSYRSESLATWVLIGLVTSFSFRKKIVLATEALLKHLAIRP